jgi:hypothetical protein
MTRAEELLARIQKHRTNEIDEMIATRVTEELFLDYKQCATAGGARALHPDDRKNLGKAISGFGNSDGGLIIWGVICTQGPNGDVPSGPAHVYDAVAFKSLLDGAIGGITIPSHRHVENFAYPVAAGPSGFVVTHVPPGDDVPFCSVDQNARGFYLRAGSSFQPVPPGILAAMFGRRPNPELELVVRPTFNFVAGGKSVDLEFAISAENRGRGIGQGAYLGIHADDGGALKYHPVFPEDWGKLPSVADRWLVFTDALRFPPGSEIKLVRMIVRIEPSVTADLKLRLHLGVVAGSGDEKQIDLYASTMDFVHEHLVTLPKQPSAIQRAVIDAIYDKLVEDETSRGRRYLTIPSQN